MNKGKRKVLIALGGNALEAPDREATAENQLKTIKEAVVHIVDIIAAGNDVVISHGNGPQVGRILLQNEAAREITPQLPLDVCGAMTQGAIGYHLQNAVVEELARRGINKGAVTLITQVEVDIEDPAFASPTKPVGPFYTAAQAAKLGAENGFVYKEDSGRGWRRVVASPQPKAVIEADIAKKLIDAGVVVILAGGGGIPVVKAENGSIKGAQAVIDKDLSSALLADQLDVDDLFVLTAVPKVALNFGKAEEVLLDKITTKEAEQYAGEGHFAPGSMLPKIEAAIGFANKKAGRRAIITALDTAIAAFNGENGTIIIK